MSVFPEERQHAVYCTACEGEMCDTVRVNNEQCVQAKHFFHETCLFHNQDEGIVVSVS